MCSEKKTTHLRWGFSNQPLQRWQVAPRWTETSNHWSQRPGMAHRIYSRPPGFDGTVDGGWWMVDGGFRVVSLFGELFHCFVSQRFDFFSWAKVETFSTHKIRWHRLTKMVLVRFFARGNRVNSRALALLRISLSHQPETPLKAVILSCVGI